VVQQDGGGGVTSYQNLTGKPSGLFAKNGGSDGFPGTQSLDKPAIATALSHDPGLAEGLRKSVRASGAATDDALATEQAIREATPEKTTDLSDVSALQTSIRASGSATDDALVTEEAAREAINNAGSNISDLADLSDVSSAKQADGHVLASGGSSYREEDVSTLASDHVPVGALKGVGTSGLSDGQVLSYTGASWANESVSSLLSGHASLADIGNVLADASTGTAGNALLLADPDADATLEWVARSVSEQIRQDGELSVGDVSIAGSSNIVKQDTEPDPTNFQAGDIWVDTDATPVPEAYVARDTDGDGALEWNATSTAIAGGNIVTNSIAAEQIQAGSITANEIEAETITADEIATGTLTADEIDAGTITANEIDADTITSRELESRSIEGTILKANTISATVIMSDVITAEQLSANTITSLEIKTDTLTADEIDTGTLTATEISSDTITASELAAGTITATEISADTITSSEVAADTLTAGEIAADTITSTEVATGTLTATQIAASTITTDELAADSISTSELQSDAATIGNVVIQGNNSVRQSTAPTAPASGQQKIWVDTSTSPPTAKKYDHVNDAWAQITSTFIDGEVIQSSSVRGREIASDTVEADNVATSTLTATEISANTITASEISANTISASEIATSTITASEVATGTLTATEISSGTITASEISANTITATEISADTITATELAADVITASEISADAVTTSELSADSVTGAQIDATSTITVGTGTPIKLDGSGDEIRSGNFDLTNESGFRLAGPSGTQSFIHDLKTTAVTASGGASFGGAGSFGGTLSAPTGEIDSVKTDAIKPQSGSSVVDVHGALRSDDYASGFAGSGFALEDDGSAEVSSLSVRETLTARSLEKQQLRYTRGANITSVGGGKVDSVIDNGGGNYTLTFATDHGLASGDLLLSQEQDSSGGTEADLSGAVTSQVRAEVTSVVDTQTVDVSTDTTYAAPSEGDDFVVVGSTSDTLRDSALLADPYGPFHDVLDGISSWSDWDNRTPKTRLGYLNGAPDLSSGDSPSGYGLYADNVYLEGTGVLDAGEIGGFSIGSSSITSEDGSSIVLNADGSFELAGGAIAGDANGNLTATSVSANSIGANEIKANAVTASQMDVNDLKAGAAKIGGWDIASGGLSTSDISLNSNLNQLSIGRSDQPEKKLAFAGKSYKNFEPIDITPSISEIQTWSPLSYSERDDLIDYINANEDSFFSSPPERAYLNVKNSTGSTFEELYSESAGFPTVKPFPRANYSDWINNVVNSNNQLVKGSFNTSQTSNGVEVEFTGSQYTFKTDNPSNSRQGNAEPFYKSYTAYAKTNSNGNLDGTLITDLTGNDGGYNYPNTKLRINQNTGEVEFTIPSREGTSTKRWYASNHPVDPFDGNLHEFYAYYSHGEDGEIFWIIEVDGYRVDGQFDPYDFTLTHDSNVIYGADSASSPGWVFAGFQGVLVTGSQNSPNWGDAYNLSAPSFGGQYGAVAGGLKKEIAPPDPPGTTFRFFPAHQNTLVLLKDSSGNILDASYFEESNPKPVTAKLPDDKKLFLYVLPLNDAQAVESNDQWITGQKEPFQAAATYDGAVWYQPNGKKGIELDGSGGEGVSQNGWTTFSDERDKIIEGRLGARGGELDALEKAKGIKGLRFKREEDGPEMVGVSAQQVEKVLPEAVSERVWNRQSGETRKAVNYQMMHGIHLEAIETLAIGAETRDQKIRRLQHRVDALETQLQNS
jgi:hypothetical protein